MFKTALVSVSDKTGLVELLTPLVAEGLRILSTGGTAQFLRDKGFSVTDVSEVTGFPEVMDGRVKTLHPNVHMGLLAKRDDPAHVKTLERFKVSGIDLVVVNLYPFEDAVLAGGSESQLVEKIDVGGPTMLRAAAKNYKHVTVLCDPNDYPAFVEKRKEWTVDDSRSFAAKTFAHISVYDSLVARQLNELGGREMTASCIEAFPFGGRRIQSLRYGENPHQGAQWYRLPGDRDGLGSSRVLQGKELSYNNILDLDAASSLVSLYDEPAAVAVKHNNPCGAAVNKDLRAALEKAVAADPVSVFGGIIAVNREIDAACATRLNEIFLECVVAPSFSAEALAIFAKKKNLRILSWPGIAKYRRPFEVRSVAGGFLVQSADSFKGVEWKNLGETPTDARSRDLRFGEKVCGVLKSNSIALVADGATVGLGMGQVNRVEAVEQALKRMTTHHPSLDPAKVSLVSDAFFPFKDSIELAAKAGIRWVLQPGGSVKDDEVIAAAKSLGVNMVMTGQRHFRH